MNTFLARRPWRRALLWLGALAPFFYLSYGLANHWAASRGGVPSVVFEWEQRIPFLAWTVLPYWTINVFYGASLFLARTRHELDRHGARLLTAQCIAVSCFVLWPLHFSFVQPEVQGWPAFFFDALRSFDQPYNQAPSLHIALAVILWDLYRRHLHGLPARAVLHVWTVAICVSVLTTYQHHAIDIPAGALLGLLCVWLWPLERRVALPRAWRLSRDRQRLKLAALYGAGALFCALLAARWGGAALVLLWGTVALALVALNYLGFGARGFQVDHQGRMGWAARVLLAPYRAAAWLNARWWTRHAGAAHEVSKGVWLGRLDAAPRRQVVSLCAELQSADAPATHCLPVLDLVVPHPRLLRRAATAIEARHRSGQPVLVGCALGYSRSAAAVLCWLLRSGRAATLEQALEQVRRARPQIVLSSAWLHAVREAAS